MQSAMIMYECVKSFKSLVKSMFSMQCEYRCLAYQVFDEMSIRGLIGFV
ncbi:hypothetical protein HanXRQr2_Chr08g0349771 [Helianthus annuus]|uniref:Uncharacterized protein n=1 Tax=Helianthus annuus TaxID=4232 RepID=A0A9K3NDY7_HELAN|nr:hypothetical protein HanXRQr2_Chr08g0349771 [Helianthus annuus]KAJ0539638.1 hypothetical protein HanHA300_Chr08g0288671 [Helianthus annuus]